MTVHKVWSQKSRGSSLSRPFFELFTHVSGKTGALTCLLLGECVLDAIFTCTFGANCHGNDDDESPPHYAAWEAVDDETGVVNFTATFQISLVVSNASTKKKHVLHSLQYI